MMDKIFLPFWWERVLGTSKKSQNIQQEHAYIEMSGYGIFSFSSSLFCP